MLRPPLFASLLAFTLLSGCGDTARLSAARSSRGGRARPNASATVSKYAAIFSWLSSTAL